MACNCLARKKECLPAPLEVCLLLCPAPAKASARCPSCSASSHSLHAPGRHANACALAAHICPLTQHRPQFRQVLSNDSRIPNCLQLKQMYAIECICRLHPGTAQQGSTQRERSWLCRPHGACPASEPRDLQLLRPPGQSLEEHLQPARRGSPLVGQRTHAQAVVMLPCACAAMTRP